jgi:hypothetical protein
MPGRCHFTTHRFMMACGLNHCAVETLEQPKVGTVSEQYRDGTRSKRASCFKFADNQGRRQRGAKWWACIALGFRYLMTCSIKQ